MKREGTWRRHHPLARQIVQRKTRSPRVHDRSGFRGSCFCSAFHGEDAERNVGPKMLPVSFHAIGQVFRFPEAKH